MLVLWKIENVLITF